MKGKRSKILLGLCLLIISACANKRASILYQPPTISVEEALVEAKQAMEDERWEQANALLLTALDANPDLAKDEEFMRKLAWTAKKEGIDDFAVEVFILEPSPAQPEKEVMP